MAITAVAGQFVATSGTSSTAIAGTLPNPPTPGNLLVAMVDCAGSVTPTATGAWTKLTQIQSTDTGALFYKIVPASDPALQTLTSAGTGSSWGVVIREFAGATGTPLLVQNNQASTTTSKASPSVSPTAGLEALVVGGAFSDGNRTWSNSAFTGSNVGSVTNVGTGARGLTGSGESCTLWYAAVTSTTGSYSATVTCSAADGGGAAVAVFRAAPTRAVAGSQPAATGTLARVFTRLRSLAGTQPAERLLTYDHSGVTYDDVDATYTGLSSGTLSYEINAGVHSTRTVTGLQPAATGTLTRVLQARRSLSGSQPAATGSLTRLKHAPRSLSGSQPAATGSLTRSKTNLRSLAGAQPTATGVLTRIHRVVRSLVGSQNSSTGTISRLRAIFRTLTGSQPFSTGTTSGRLSGIRSLVGNQPASTGVLTRSANVARLLVGSQGTASGVLVRLAAFLRTVPGNQPNPTGRLIQGFGVYTRLLHGVQPSATGDLFARHVRRHYVVPDQGTSPDEYEMTVQPDDRDLVYAHRQTDDAVTAGNVKPTVLLVSRSGSQRVEHRVK